MIRDGVLRWRPAVDVNRVVLVAQLVVVTALLTLRLYLKLRVRRASATVPAEPRTTLWGSRMLHMPLTSGD